MQFYERIRNLYGRESQRKLGADNFDWKAFKAQFEICFGRSEDCRYTTEQLLIFAQNKFNMGLEDLLAYNRKSWELRLVNNRSIAIRRSRIFGNPLPSLTASIEFPG